MTFKQLVLRLIQEAAISGTLTTVVGQTGEFKRAVDWVNSAFEELQTAQTNWTWMRSSVLEGGGVSFATVAGQAVYPLGTIAGTVGVAADNFGSWIRTTFRGKTTTVGVSDELFLDWVPYDVWRDAYAYGTQQLVQTRQVAIAIAPDNAICLGPYPNALYTITGDYYRAPSLMALDADVPTGLPTQFHMAIVYKALEYYGGYEGAPEALTRGQNNYRRLYRKLSNMRLPEITAGQPLA